MKTPPESSKWSPEKIQEVIQAKFPGISMNGDIESQLSSIEIMDLLLAFENSLGLKLHAIELEPLLRSNFALFCKILNAKHS